MTDTSKIRIDALHEVADGDEGFDGYQIVLSDKTVWFLGIANGSQCCERWGYFSPQDDLSYYIGAEFQGLFFTTYGQDRIELPPDVVSMDAGDVAFVSIMTSLGVLNLAVYNAHNGSYGHRVILEKNHQQIDETVL